MTLILALANSDQVIQISDRRLSCNGQLVDDESNKASALTCADGRFVFGFTGLARAGDFKTQQWLVDTVLDCSPPEYTILEILKRLGSRVTETFQTAPAITRLALKDRRLSILFTGYLDGYDPPLGAMAILTNFQDFETGQDSPEAWEQFRGSYWSEQRPFERPYRAIQIVGAWHAVTHSDVEALRVLLEDRKPPAAIIGKAAELVRSMAERPRAAGTIGKQLSSICLFRDPNLGISADYHTEIASYSLPFPSHIIAVNDTNRLMVGELSITLHGDAGPAAIRYPKVSRNAPCPCKSGKRYKHCHGR